MKKDAITNIKGSFEANPNVDTLYANQHGHCFTSNGEGLTAVNRAEVDTLKADEDEVEGVEETEEEKEIKLRVELDARAEKVNLPVGSSEEDIKAAEKAAKKKK